MQVNKLLKRFFSLRNRKMLLGTKTGELGGWSTLSKTSLLIQHCVLEHCLNEEVSDLDKGLCSSYKLRLSVAEKYAFITLLTMLFISIFCRRMHSYLWLTSMVLVYIQWNNIFIPMKFHTHVNTFISIHNEMSLKTSN